MQRRPAHGFTLIEVLVAISVMALMALMAWRGLDGMLRTQTGLQMRADDIRTLQAGLAQWQTDLDQLSEHKGIDSWDWDGKVLRLTRRSPVSADSAPDQGTSEAVQVVAWTWRNDPDRIGGGDWQRWASPPLHTRAAWQEAWQQAHVWSQTPTPASLAAQIQIHPLAGWQLFVHRGGAWTNPLSSDAVNGPAAHDNVNSVNTATATRTPGSTPPDGVRLILMLPPGAAGQGTLTLDWIRPTLSGAPA